MRDLAILFIHLITTLVRLASPGGVRSVVAESVLVRHQLLILNRSRQRAPNLRLSDRMVAGWCVLFLRPCRLIRSAIVLKPSTLLHLHHVLIQRKYRLLFSPKGRRQPGPKGPSQELRDAIVATKQRNPSWGCPVVRRKLLWAVPGSRRDPLKSVFVVQSSQDGFGQHSMIARNRVSGEWLHRAARLGYSGTQAAVWAASVVQPRDQIPIKLRREECAIRGTRGTGGASMCEESATDTA